MSYLESVEVTEVSLGLASSKLLAPGGLSPLVLDVGSLEGLGEGGLAGTTGDRDDNVGEADVLEVNNLTLDTSDVLGAIDESLSKLREMKENQRHGERKLVHQYEEFTFPHGILGQSIALLVIT